MISITWKDKILKKIKENTLNSTGIDEENSINEANMRKRQRRRSSTISFDKRLIHEEKSKHMSSDSTSSNSDDDDDEVNSNEHAIPCSCDRDRCKLIKTIIEKYSEQNIL